MNNYPIPVPSIPAEEKAPNVFTILDNYIAIPTMDIEIANERLLQFYKQKKIKIKLRLHSKNEYEFKGEITKIYGIKETSIERKDEEIKEYKDEGTLTKKQLDEINQDDHAFIDEIGHPWWRHYIILKDKEDNEIKLFLADIDHRTIMPEAMEVIKPHYVFERENIPAKLRFAILEKYSHTCQYCGRKPPEVTLHIDHIIPVSKGGQTIMENLLVSCRDCNLGKSDKILGETNEE